MMRPGAWLQIGVLGVMAASLNAVESGLAASRERPGGYVTGSTNLGLWYSFAQWLSAESREAAVSSACADLACIEQMRAAIAEALPEVVLESVADFLRLPPTGNLAA